MKTTITLIVMLLSLGALAEETYIIPEYMFMPNDSGNFMTLSEDDCTIERFRTNYPFKAWSTDEDGVDHIGCWNITVPDPRGLMEQIVSLKFDEVSDNITLNFRYSKFSSKKERWE